MLSHAVRLRLSEVRRLAGMMVPYDGRGGRPKLGMGWRRRKSRKSADNLVGREANYASVLLGFWHSVVM